MDHKWSMTHGPWVIKHNLWCTVCDAVKGITAEIFQTVSPCSPTSWSHQQIHPIRTEFIATTIESVTNIITNAIGCGTIAQCISVWIGQGWVVYYIAIDRPAHNETAEFQIIQLKSKSQDFSSLTYLLFHEILHLLPKRNTLLFRCSYIDLHNRLSILLQST